MGWAQVENKTESTIEGEKAKLTCPMSKSSEAPQDQGNLLRGIVICQPCRPWGCHTMDHSDQKCKETSG